MKKHQILEHIHIEKLVFGGSGLATAPDGRRIIVTGGAIPGAVVNLRILKVKKSHIEAQIVETVKKSPLEQPIREGWQLYGGCKWLPIPYADQLRIKEEQIREAFHLLVPSGRVNEASESVSVSLSEGEGSGVRWHPIIASPETEGYRNKVEFSWGKYISGREGIHEEYRFGFHVPAQFDRIEDCRYCVLADDEINSIFRFVDRFARESDVPTYDPKMGKGFWRHFVVRKSKKTGQTMLIFSVNTNAAKTLSEDVMREFAKNINKEFSSVRTIILLKNTGRADIVYGEEVILLGDGIIEEELLGMHFEIQPRSFFQVNTLGAEKLYTRVMEYLTPQPPFLQRGEVISETPSPSGEGRGEVLLDLYAGTGTIGILLAKHFSRVYSVELASSSSQDGVKNALKNQVHNVEFINAKVEDFAEKFASEGGGADTIVLDPPRDGLYPGAIPHILSFGAREIIYVSCNPATLVRDLQIMLGGFCHSELAKNPEGGESEHGSFVPQDDETSKKIQQPKYRITDITPVDMFPHTHHIETVVRLQKI